MGAVALLAVILVVLIVILILIVVLVAVLVVVLVAVLVVVLIALITVLVIHNSSSENLYLRQCRFHSVSDILAFIPGFEKKARKKTGCDCCSNAAGTGLQTSCEDTEKTILRNSLFYALGQIITESG